MQDVTENEMNAVDGGSWHNFWEGVACGVGIVATVSLVLAPEFAASKAAAYTTGAMTLAACGAALS